MKKQISSPFAIGAKCSLRHERRVFTYKDTPVEIVYYFYECQATFERVTTDEIDNHNLNAVYEEYHRTNT